MASRVCFSRFCRRFGCCPYYRDIRNSEMSTRRELAIIIWEPEILEVAAISLKTLILNSDSSYEVGAVLIQGDHLTLIGLLQYSWSGDQPSVIMNIVRFWTILFAGTERAF